MFRLFVRIGVTAALSVLMVYLYLIFIAVYQDNQPLPDVTLETTVRGITIAGPGETADVRWVSPYERKQWIVVFDVDRMLQVDSRSTKYASSCIHRAMIWACMKWVNASCSSAAAARGDIRKVAQGRIFARTALKPVRQIHGRRNESRP